MHSHRRANSYSQGAGVAPFWKLGSNAISSENVNSQSAIARATPERRSTGRRSTYSKGYGAVTICKPAVVKFAVNEDPWVVVANDMSLRPRSPSKSRTGSSSDMHQLDQTLAFIRDQLVSNLADKLLSQLNVFSCNKLHVMILFFLFSSAWSQVRENTAFRAIGLISHRHLQN